jgi:integrase
MNPRHSFPGSTALAHCGGERILQSVAALTRPPEQLTLRDLVDRYMRVYTGHDTALPQRLSAWCALIGDLTLSEINSDVVHVCREAIRDQPALAYKGTDAFGQPIFLAKRPGQAKSGTTLNKYVSALGSVCTWAIHERLVPRGWAHPCRGVKRIEEPRGRVRFLDAEERARLLEACKASQYPRLHALVLMAMLTGARRGELLGLRWREVELDAGRAHLHDTKNGDRRTLVLLPAVVEALRPFVSTDTARLVFGSVQSRYQRAASIDTAWRLALARAQVGDFRFHDLRHCCASYLAQAGVPLNTIAEILGHRKLDMTRRYAHLTTTTTAAAMSAALGAIVPVATPSPCPSQAKPTLHPQ